MQRTPYIIFEIFLSFLFGEHPIHHFGPKRLSRTVARLQKIVYNICGLACILGQVSFNNQVSLTTKERSVQS